MLSLDSAGKCQFRGCAVTNTEHLLGRYKELEASLGLYFAFTFTTAQLNWISQLYMGVVSLNSPYPQLVRALFTGGAFLAASGGENRCNKLDMIISGDKREREREGFQESLYVVISMRAR